MTIHKIKVLVLFLALSGCASQQQESPTLSDTERLNALGGNTYPADAKLADETNAVCVLTKPIPSGKTNTSTGITLNDIFSSLPRVQWGNTLSVVNQGEESVVFDEPNGSSRYVVDLKNGNLSIVDKQTEKVLNSGKCKIEVGLTADKKEFMEKTFLESCLKSPQEIQSPEDYAKQQADPVNAHTIAKENEVERFSREHSAYYQEISCSFLNEFTPPFGRGNELEFHDLFDENPLVSPQCSNWRTLVIVNRNEDQLVFDESNDSFRYTIDLNGKQVQVKEKFTQKVTNTGLCKLYERKQPTKEQWDAFWKELGLTKEE